MVFREKKVKRLRFLLSHGLMQTQIASRMNESQQTISYQVKKLRRKFMRSGR